MLTSSFMCFELGNFKSNVQVEWFDFICKITYQKGNLVFPPFYSFKKAFLTNSEFKILKFKEVHLNNRYMFCPNLVPFGTGKKKLPCQTQTINSDDQLLTTPQTTRRTDH